MTNKHCLAAANSQNSGYLGRVIISSMIVIGLLSFIIFEVLATLIIRCEVYDKAGSVFNDVFD